MTSLIKSRVVLDTNIFISGSAFGGNSGRILELFRNDQIQVVVSPQIELEVISHLPKFTFERTTIFDLKSLLERKAIRITPTKKVRLCRDPKDNKFLEACLESNANFLITGDKDLLVLKNFKQTKILNPKDFLKIVKKS